MIVPRNLVNKAGEPTEEGRRFLQTIANAQGGPAWLVVAERVDDENIRFKMTGKDGVTRTSANIALS